MTECIRGEKSPDSHPQIYRHNSKRKRLLYSVFCIYFGRNSTYGLWLRPKCLTKYFIQ